MTQAMLAGNFLSAAQCDAYEDQGFLVLRGLFAQADLRRAAAEAEALLERKDLISTRNLRCRWQPNVITGECRFETFDPVIDIAPVCRELAYDARLLAVLAALYG